MKHQKPGDWKSISSAPRDGSHILAWGVLIADELDEDDRVIRRDVREDQPYIVYFCFGEFVEFPFRGTRVTNLRFTHWMPLPDAPRAHGEQEKPELSGSDT